MLNQLLRSAGCVIALTLAVGPETLLAQQAQADDAVAITRIRGDLYRFQNGRQTSVFLATTDGILLVDPLSGPFVRRLKAEFDMRFPGVPVKYVVYTQLDVDRNGGAAVFKPAAQVVAHETLNARLRESRRVLPRGYVAYDRNMNRTLEADELAGVGNADSVLNRDVNRDGHVTAEELWSQTLDADSTYATSRVITLGTQRIELLYTGPGIGIGATALYFQNERLLFVGDHPPLTAPFADRSIRPVSITMWTQTVAQRDFEMVLAGNGDEISREQVIALDGYARGLLAGVTEGLQSGHTIAQIQRDSTIDSFAGTPFAGTRNADIAFLYQRTRPMMVDTYGSAIGDYISVDSTTCVASPVFHCEFGRTTGLAATVGAGISIKKLRFAVELSRGTQLTQSGADTSSGLRQNSRETHLSFLGGYRTAPPGTFNITLLGGYTIVNQRKAGVAVGQSGVPFGRFAIEEMRRAFTFGGDIAVPMGRRFGLIAPIRLTVPGQMFILYPSSQSSQSAFDFRAGAGLTFNVYRRVQ